MALSRGVCSGLNDISLSNVMQVELLDKQITTSDILQQALEEASQNIGQGMEESETSISESVEITPENQSDNLSRTSELLTSPKLLELSENHTDMTITFSDNANANVISISDSISLDNFTVPVFTAESNEAVSLALGNLPMNSLTSSVTLNISDNTVTFPCNMSGDSVPNCILRNSGMLDNDNGETSDKSILVNENAIDLLDSIAGSDSLSNPPKITQDVFPTELEGFQSTSVESADVSEAPSENNIQSLTLLQPRDTDAPIGSSENPIQIVQHGTTYHSTQALNHEQLAQIAQVLQQQQVTKSIEKGRSAVLYNQSTNTRIVYRVVYPSGVHSKIGDSKKGPESRSFQQTSKGVRGRARKAWSRRPLEDERKVDGPDMSREEKEERKKHRPRTRSGRISKPPSYMIKDYKRIHHLDFNEEPQNESDGGYSDFHLSEEENQQSDDTNNALPPGVSTVKPRNYKCSTCDKAYIGRGGLARHYKLSPGHGTLTPEEGENLNDTGLSDENSMGSESSQPLPPLQEDSQSNEITEVTPALPVLTEGVVEKESECLLPEDPPIQKPKDEQQLAHLAKKRAKLKELIQPFADSDLLEVVMPRLSQALTLWEFLLLKSEKGDPSLPHVPDIFQHFEDLLNRLQLLAQDCLVLTSASSSAPVNNVALSSSNTSPPSTPILTDENKVYVEITNERVGQVLGVSTGLYEVVKWKLLQLVPSLMRRTSVSQSSSVVSKRPAIQSSLLEVPTPHKRLKKNPTCVSGIFNYNIGSLAVRESVLKEDSSSLTTFPVEENCNLEINPNLTGNGTILNKAVRLLEDRQNAEQFSVISSQNQDFSFSGSLDSSCHVTSTEEIPCLSISNSNNNVTLSQNLIFCSPCVTTTATSSELQNFNSTKMSNLDLTDLRKVNIFDKDNDFLSALPSEKSVKTYSNLAMNIPNVRVKKVNIFPKNTNLLSLTESELLSSSSGKETSCLRISNGQGSSHFLKGSSLLPVNRTATGATTSGFLKDGALLTVSRTGESELDMSKTPPTVEVSSSFLSLLGDNSVVMDVPLTSLTTTPLTVMSGNSSLSSIPPLDALLSQNEISHFRISEESTALQDALTHALDGNQSKELECPSNSADGIPVIQLVVPELSSGMINSPSTSSNNFETMEGTEPVENHLLPQNVIIVQNEDGTTTLQLPTDQPFSLEAIQALLAMDNNFAAEILKEGLNTSLETNK